MKASGRQLASVLVAVLAMVGAAEGAEKPPPDSEWRLHLLSRCEPHAPIFPASRPAMEEALALFRLENGGDAVAVLEDALAGDGSQPWLRLLLAQIYVLAGQGEPHCRPLEGPVAATGDWPDDRLRWLERADALLASLAEIWPDDGLVDFLRADAARAAGDHDSAAEHDFAGRSKCSHRKSLQFIQALRDLRPRPPRVTEPIEPGYPPECVRKGIEGEVLLDLLIDPQGRAVEAVVIGRADHRLAAAAREAALGGGFQAARLGYYPVWSWLRVPVLFSLEN